MKERISVIIPCYNYGRFVQDAITSALNQTYPVHEIVVVNNGSTDETATILSGLSHAKVKVIEQENRGQSGARNRALELASGDFIAFLDADDTWDKNKIELQMKCFSAERVVLVYCGLRKVDERLTQIQNEEIISPKFRGDVLPRFLDQVGAVVCGGESTAIVRKNALDRAGRFDPNLSIGTGWDMWRRLASLGEVAYVDEPLVNYRQHGSNHSKNLLIYEHDTEIKLKKVFQDKHCEKVFYLKSIAYYRHRVSLAKAYFRNRNYFRALTLLVKALFSRVGAEI